jgi:hypothetical protein
MKTRGKTCRRDQIGYLVFTHWTTRTQHPCRTVWSQKTKLSNTLVNTMRVSDINKKGSSVWTIKLLECRKYRCRSPHCQHQHQHRLQLRLAPTSAQLQLQHQNRRKDYTIWSPEPGRPSDLNIPLFGAKVLRITCMDVCVFCCKDITGFIHWQSIHERIRATFSQNMVYTFMLFQAVFGVLIIGIVTTVLYVTTPDKKVSKRSFL